SGNFTNAENIKNQFFAHASSQRAGKESGDAGGSHNLAEDSQALANFFNSIANIDNDIQQMTLAVNEQEFNNRKQQLQKLQSQLNQLQNIQAIHQKEILQLEAEIKEAEAKYQENFTKANNETDPAKKAKFITLANEALDEISKLKRKYQQNPIANLSKYDYLNDLERLLAGNLTPEPPTPPVNCPGGTSTPDGGNNPNGGGSGDKNNQSGNQQQLLIFAGLAVLQQGLLLLLLAAGAAYYYFMVYLPDEERKVLEEKIQTELEKVKKIQPNDYDNITSLLITYKGTEPQKLALKNKKAALDGAIDISGTLVAEYQEEVNLFPSGDKHPNFHFSRTAAYEIFFPPSLQEHYEAGKDSGETNLINPVRGDMESGENNALFFGMTRTGKSAVMKNLCFEANKYPLVIVKGSSLTPRLKTYGLERKANGEVRYILFVDECNQISNNSMTFDPNLLQFVKECIEGNKSIMATNHLNQIEEAVYQAGRLASPLNFNEDGKDITLTEEVEIEDDNGNKKFETEEQEIEIGDGNLENYGGTFKSLKKSNTEDVLEENLPEVSNMLAQSSNELNQSLENLRQEIEALNQQMQVSAANSQIVTIQNNINTLFKLVENTTTIVATVAAGIATGGASLVIQAVAIGGAYLVGSALDADRKQKEQEDKKLALAGKAGEAIAGQVSNLQNQRNQVVQESEELIKELQKHKAKINDPNATPEEKELAKKMIPIIQAQLDEKSKQVSDFDRKINDLLKNIPDGSNKGGGLANLELDNNTKLIIGAIIFLIIYFAFIKEKEK
ncbi:27403_t:CDS:10, partial [Gigaspora margarita]